MACTSVFLNLDDNVIREVQSIKIAKALWKKVVEIYMQKICLGSSIWKNNLLGFKWICQRTWNITWRSSRESPMIFQTLERVLMMRFLITYCCTTYWIPIEKWIWSQLWKKWYLFRPSYPSFRTRELELKMEWLHIGGSSGGGDAIYW